ncbi:aldose epimerase family protein [Flavobacteriaceae bacterium M23B6Z8]
MMIKQFQIATNRIKLKAINYGGILSALHVKDSRETFRNIVIGHEKLENYYTNPYYLGASVGPFAGRISGGAFQLNEKLVELDAVNDVHLHGGLEGWSKKFWLLDELQQQNKEPFIRFKLSVKEEDTQYPGNITALVTYLLTQDNDLIIRYEVTTDKDTIINITNHSYFNLSGSGNPIDNHLLKINADTYLETDAALIPTGKIVPVKGTHMDFTESKALGNSKLDDTYILHKTAEPQIEITAPDTRIQMQISTNQPGVVVYTPTEFPAICFETQNFPDAPNHQHFPSSLLRAGDLYVNESRFHFTNTP